MDHAVARYDWGRWVADDPSPDCANALELTLGQQEFVCRWTNARTGLPEGCGTVAPIDWPADPAAIEASLADLPESMRNWQPELEPEPEQDGGQPQ